MSKISGAFALENNEDFFWRDYIVRDRLIVLSGEEGREDCLNVADGYFGIIVYVRTIFREIRRYAFSGATNP
jgi:hypothetical protein